mmetsp:Transcript_37941/g.55640  ORF Transcript_37941/g.55640 Transcript_37941/m.55640 type:complete len:84 (-) Transcript_37941:305-556(-)
MMSSFWDGAVVTTVASVSAQQLQTGTIIIATIITTTTIVFKKMVLGWQIVTVLQGNCPPIPNPHVVAMPLAKENNQQQGSLKK